MIIAPLTISPRPPRGITSKGLFFRGSSPEVPSTELQTWGALAHLAFPAASGAGIGRSFTDKTSKAPELVCSRSNFS